MQLYKWYCSSNTVSCILYPVSCVLYSVSCILYPVSCILYLVSCIQYPVSCILYPVSCILCPVSFILYPVSSILYHVSSILYSVSCILCLVFGILYPVSSSFIKYPVAVAVALAVAVAHGEWNKMFNCNFAFKQFAIFHDLTEDRLTYCQKKLFTWKKRLCISNHKDIADSPWKTSFAWTLNSLFTSPTTKLRT